MNKINWRKPTPGQFLAIFIGTTAIWHYAWVKYCDWYLQPRYTDAEKRNPNYMRSTVFFNQHTARVMLGKTNPATDVKQ